LIVTAALLCPVERGGLPSAILASSIVLILVLVGHPARWRLDTATRDALVRESWPAATHTCAFDSSDFVFHRRGIALSRSAIIDDDDDHWPLPCDSCQSHRRRHCR
jgi:hypothetical protein